RPSEEASVGELRTRSWKMSSNRALSRASPLPGLDTTAAMAGASVSGSSATVAPVARNERRSINLSRNLRRWADFYRAHPVPQIRSSKRELRLQTILLEQIV